MQALCNPGPGVAAAFLGAMLWTSVSLTQEAVPPPPDPQPVQGIDVQNQGPVHEAYAEPVTGQAQPGPIVPKQPPDPVDEIPPDQKPVGNNVQWISGYWQWDDQSAGFLWVSGFWRDVPPDKEWVPGFWNQVDGGWQWVPGYWADATQQQVTYLPPPPASIDNGPSAPAANPDDIYVPGVWIYQQTRYFWRPGFFVTYNPSWVYVPAHYFWCPAGYVFEEGYWDYPLDQRGLLFAPVVFEATLLARPGWSYTPQYVVSPTMLVTALFVRPGYLSYYFGDYFDAAYVNRGFVPWVDYKIGKASADPLFTYLTYQNRGNAKYLQDLRTLYAQRTSGQAPRPPRTLALLQQAMSKAKGDKAAKGNVSGLSMVTPLREVARQGIKVQAVPKEEIEQQHKSVQQQKAVQTARQKAEVKAVGPGGPITKPTEPPRTVKTELPRVTAPSRTVKPELPRVPEPKVKAPAAAPARAVVQRPLLPQPPQHVTQPEPKHAPLPPVRAPSQPLPRIEPPRTPAPPRALEPPREKEKGPGR